MAIFMWHSDAYVRLSLAHTIVDGGACGRDCNKRLYLILVGQPVRHDRLVALSITHAVGLLARVVHEAHAGVLALVLLATNFFGQCALRIRTICKIVKLEHDFGTMM